jgi:UDP-N-acetylmuramoyl-L-alanyl-D-glutamate--2,6-diaminopimelate ligase
MAAEAVRPMTLGDVIGAAAPATLAGHPVADLSLDSRRIVPGAMFLAVQGTREHGLRHAAAAAAAGAGMVAWEPADGADAPRLPGGCTAFPVPGLRARLGEIADRFFGHPSRHVRVVGVTGTNGKTTCTHLVAGALERLHRPVRIIGTLGSGRLGRLDASALTTPDVIEVHRQLAAFAAEGARDVAMEVSSHALDQGRVDGVRYAVAAFTNLSRDHLDYHTSLEAYGESKARLFLAHSPAVSVINASDAFGRALAARLPAGARRITVGARREDLDPAGESLLLGNVEALAGGLRMTLSGSFGTGQLHARLVGDFNAENLALAAGILLALGVALPDALAALAAAEAPAGRMEAFPEAARGVLAVVDYAHTPDALAKALAALRRHCKGRLWCVFGCGGDRDRGKRPEMGRVAEQLADEMVITDDNPRHEEGGSIIADILGGLENPGRARIERDRAAAIGAALAAASAGDVVLIAGKGHEDVQIVGDTRRPYSDRLVVAGLAGGAR